MDTGERNKMAEPQSDSTGIMKTLMSDVMRRWIAGLGVGLLLGTGGMATVSKTWPDANVQAIDATMTAVMDRIDKLEIRSTAIDLLMNERQRVGDSNAIRIASLETRLGSDINEIKTAVLRLGDRLERHFEKTEKPVP